MNERLTDDLLGLVPDRPDPSGWGPRVRRRSGRRRALAGGAATALVIGVAVALSTTLGGAGPNVAGARAVLTDGDRPHGSRSHRAGDRSAPSASPSVATRRPRRARQAAAGSVWCRAAGVPPRGLRSAARGALRGATRVRLCGDPESAIAGEGQIGPRSR